ncbi:hypothetical protein ACFLZ9_00655 [Patescibacteria group bacterium]
MAKPWMKWSFLEAGTRATSVMFQKCLGIVSDTFGQAMLGTFVVGFIQVLCSSIVIRIKRKKIFSSKRHILGSVWFGFNAAVCTVLPFYTFVLGADSTIRTFIVCLSIIPGALIDKYYFNNSLEKRQWLGVLVAIIAGYSILGWPSLNEFITLPLWVWLSFVMTGLVAVNQGVTQWIKDVDPMVKNFWGGSTTLIFAVIGLVILLSLDLVKLTDSRLIEILTNTQVTQKIILFSGLAGLIVILMWSFNVLGYRDGAKIAIKKLVVQGSYLGLVAIFGTIFFPDETWTLAKTAGIALYLFAFSLMDNDTWEYFTQTAKNNHARPSN